MIGSGSVVFAVWPYVIANMRADKEVGAQVDLNPKLLAAIFGEDEKEVEKAIGKLCSPDPESTSKSEEGRRLVRVGQFAYRVVNGEHYMGIRNLDQKREYDRNQKRRKRASGKAHSLPNEAAAVRAINSGDEAHADRLAAERASVAPSVPVAPRPAVSAQVPVVKAPVPVAVVAKPQGPVDVKDAIHKSGQEPPTPVPNLHAGWSEQNKQVPQPNKS